jgi:hypothetical protein
MLNDLQAWFFWDATTLSSVVMAGVAVVALAVFYALLRKKDVAPVEDPYEEFLAEEFKIVPVKVTEFLKLPPEPKVVVFDEPVTKKPTAKKTAKKKAAKKAAAKKTAKAKVEKK